MLTNYCKAGFTLIELIITMSLGLLLTGLFFTTYIANQKSDQLQTTINQIQNNANNAINLLNTEIHRTGYIGCANLTNDFPIISYQDYSIKPSNKLIGNKNELTIRHMDDSNTILQNTQKNKSVLYTSKEIEFAVNDILIISNCKKAEIFQVASVFITKDYQKITSTHPLQEEYQSYAEIGRLVINRYFIAKTNRINPNGSSVFALYVEDIFHRKFELVDGINHMNIMYTLKKNGRLIDASAPAVHDWSKVLGVHINLTIFSPPITKHWYSYVAIP
ncbi:MAG TPA: prepilin-type N-terminal cleavage/methylation domain-containing protein [Gammaproteobacteria bacterium]|nr:prepilin-type N-terminal cleavage/methylation domain-containing protein [Gammaproteobacteria bacterium]